MHPLWIVICLFLVMMATVVAVFAVRIRRTASELVDAASSAPSFDTMVSFRNVQDRRELASSHAEQARTSLQQSWRRRQL